MYKEFNSKDYIYYNEKEEKTKVYKFQAKTKNLIFYKCSKPPKFKGSGKLNL